jgi:hypothetical protein
MRSRLSGLAAVLVALPLAAAEPDSDWMDRLSAFKCKHSIELDALSVDPLQLAMIAPCWRKQPRPEPHQGPYSLITVDAAREELRVLRVSAFYYDGIHYAGDGRIIWFSALNAGLVGQEQRFVEAFSLEPQSLSERSLGRIELPFVAHSTNLTKGGGCHILGIHSRPEANTPQQHRFWLFEDGDPIGSGRMVTGIEGVLFWEPRGRVFVAETARAAELPGNAVHREALDCSGQLLPLDDALASRLADVDGSPRRYLVSATGDLLSTGFSSERPALLFRDASLTRLAPFIRCFDPVTCEDVFASGLGWSSSGEHFALLQPGGTLEVYRTADLAVVHERPLDLYDDFLFVDDRAVYFATRRGRFVRDAWR